MSALASVSFAKPKTVAEALALRSAAAFAPLAGGTDFYPAHVGRAINQSVLDLSQLSELRGIADRGDHTRIGALTTWRDIAAAPLPDYFRGLQNAAKEIGGQQIQNRGTLVGNICNASPAADGIPALLALEASVEIIDPARFI